MARPRGFDEDDVLRNAMLAFWRLGYEQTSVTDLEAATGLSRMRLYNAFGDKESLFVRALDQYRDRVAAELARGFSEGSLEELVDFVHFIVDARPPECPEHFGCLVVNAVLGVGRPSAAIIERIHAYRSMLTRTFREVIVTARAADQIRSDIDPDDAADFLVHVFWGAATITRLHHDVTAARPAVRVLVQVIDGWRQPRAAAGTT